MPYQNDLNMNGTVKRYHSESSYSNIAFNGVTPFRIGFEIEKEDAEIKASCQYTEIERFLWRKEEDGSLNNYEGFELVSPIYELNSKLIYRTIKKQPLLVAHINADVKTTCGGHINISEDNKTGLQLFSKLCGYSPLLYALYYGRVSNSYCMGKSNVRLVADREKYQAINIRTRYVEIRIFSAVVSLEQLIWRTELLELLLRYPTNSVELGYYRVQTRIKTHLQKVYNTPEKFDEFIKRYEHYSELFENITLSNITAHIPIYREIAEKNKKNFNV